MTRMRPVEDSEYDGAEIPSYPFCSLASKHQKLTYFKTGGFEPVGLKDGICRGATFVFDCCYNACREKTNTASSTSCGDVASSFIVGRCTASELLFPRRSW